MEHRPLVNLIWWQLKPIHPWQGRPDLAVRFARALMFRSRRFFSTWCSGGVLMLVDEELRHDPGRLLRFLS